MKYTINQNGSTAIEKNRKKHRRYSIIFSIITAIGTPMIVIERLFPGGSFDVETGIFIFLWVLICGYFIFFLPYRRLTLILRNTIYQIDIDGENCVFNFSSDLNKYAVPMCFKKGDIEIIPADKNESIVFKEKTFIVFNDFGKKAYFIDEYFDDAALILDQLDIKSKSPRYNEFLNGIFLEGKSLKNRLFFKIPIINIVLLSGIIITGFRLNISLLSIFLGVLLFSITILGLNVYPLIRKARLINHIVRKIEVNNNYCYLYCHNIFENESYYKVYELKDIAIGEREVYQETFFKSERFLVLNANELKFYLHGDLLSQHEPVFNKNNVAKSLVP